MDNQIAKESIEMAQHGLQVRDKLLKEGKLSPEYNPEMESVHKNSVASVRINYVFWITMIFSIHLSIGLKF